MTVAQLGIADSTGVNPGHPGNMASVDTGTLIVETMKEFIEGLRLKGDPMSHIGFPLENRMDRYYLPYLLGMADCPDTP